MAGRTISSTGAAPASPRQAGSEHGAPGTVPSLPKRSRAQRTGGPAAGLDARARARDLLAREVNIRKPHGGRLRVALAFPNTYFVGMSNLGLQTVYRLFNADERVVCERVFLPPKQEIAALGAARAARHHRVPDTCSRFRRPRFLRLLRMGLHQCGDDDAVGGVEPLAADRHPRDPLIVIGGAVTFVNPEPLAPFADDRGRRSRSSSCRRSLRRSKAPTLRTVSLCSHTSRAPADVSSLCDVTYDGPGRVAAITPRPGSGAPPVVQKAAVRGADRLDPPSTSIFTPDTEFGSRLLIEVVRGCANLCRFCWAGYNYLPVRPFSTERILDIAAAARPHATRVGLVSIALCDHPDIELILERLVAMGYGISPASLRLDDLTEPIVRLLRQSGERSITIAPETGSDRLRRVINKTVTNEDILDRADLIFRCGIENLKLYYMLGLPTETDDDLVAIRDLTMAIRERMLEHGRARRRRADRRVRESPRAQTRHDLPVAADDRRARH